MRIIRRLRDDYLFMLQVFSQYCTYFVIIKLKIWEMTLETTEEKIKKPILQKNAVKSKYIFQTVLFQLDIHRNDLYGQHLLLMRRNSVRR